LKITVFLNNVIINKTKVLLPQAYVIGGTRVANISAISWRPVLVVEEVGVPGENHRPWVSNW
jgi:hypothetical protein